MPNDASRHTLRVIDFTETPGARYEDDGPYSGEVFRNELLVPEFEAALSSGAILLVDLDGTFGYATSFLEEAFGGLAEMFGADTVLKHLEIKTDDEPTLKAEIEEYIRKGPNRKVSSSQR